MARALQLVVPILMAALLLLGTCDGRGLKESAAASRAAAAAAGGGSSGEEKDTGLPLIPKLPPVLDPSLPLPPVVPGIPPARKSP
jgi:hypothetical protein